MSDENSVPPVFSPDSIFDCIKKLLNVDVEDFGFDMDIIMHINSALMVLTQIGIGPVEGFVITDNTSKWQDFIGNSIKLEAIRTYIYLKVKLVFDPPASTTVLDAMSRSVTEFEWRLNVQADPIPVTEEVDDEC